MIAVRQQAVYREHKQPVYAMTAAGTGFFSGGGDKIILYHDLSSAAPARPVACMPYTIYSLLFLPDTQLLVAGQSMGGLHIIDLAAGKEIKYILQHTGGVFCLVHDAPGGRVFAASADGSVSVWDHAAFAPVASLQLSEEKIRSISIAPDLSCIAAACSDAFIRILDYHSLQVIHEFRAHGWATNTVCWHPSKNWLLSASRDAHLRVWDADNNFALLHDIPAHNYAVYSICNSPGGKWIATCSRDKTIKLWDADTMDFLVRINQEKYNGHVNSVNTLLWLAKPDCLLSGSDDRTIMRWGIE